MAKRMSAAEYRRIYGDDHDLIYSDYETSPLRHAAATAAFPLQQVWLNGMSGLETGREIAIGLRRLPRQASRRVFAATMRPAAATYERRIRAAERACLAALEAADGRFEAARQSLPEWSFGAEHDLGQTYSAEVAPARAAFAAEVEAAKVAFRATLADALEEAAAA